VAYYDPDRLGTLEAVVARLRDVLPQTGVSEGSPGFGEVYRPKVLRMAFVLLLGKLGLLRKSTFAFRMPEIRFVLTKLQALVNLLGSKEKPAQDEIIAARMAMYGCQRLLEGPCFGLPELKRADRVEHFLYPAHWQPVKLDELVGERS
jgi:hypothetical protein